MLERLGLVIHRIGFLCLGTSISLFAITWLIFAAAGEIMDLSDAMRYFGSVLVFEQRAILSVMLWIGIASYPIKWILTGNKSFFPWKS